MDDRSVLHLVGAGGDVQVDVDVLGSVNPTVGRLSGPVEPPAPSPGTRGRKSINIPASMSKPAARKLSIVFPPMPGIYVTTVKLMFSWKFIIIIIIIIIL